MKIEEIEKLADEIPEGNFWQGSKGRLYIREQFDKLIAVAKESKDLTQKYRLEFHGSFGPLYGHKEDLVSDMFAPLKQALENLEKE